jgi:MoaA/NifB/PqqE/SkfB family radical SAM enzyme
MSYLSTIIKDRKILCPAKSVFSYIAGNGYVMPCPYLPIVFGDIKKESMTEILSRMHEHPLMSQGGLYCPTRDKDYLETMLKGVGPHQPFILARSLNRINCHAMCNNRCRHCQASGDGIDVSQLLKAVGNVDKKYKTVHLYGGEIFTHKDIFPVLEKIGMDFELVIYSNARVFVDHALARRLQRLNIKAIKVPVFSFSGKSFDRITGVPGSFRQTLLGISNLCKAGISVSIYVPEKEAKRDITPFISLGVVSVSSFKTGGLAPLPDSVLCFGSQLQKTRLLWLKN